MNDQASISLSGWERPGTISASVTSASDARNRTPIATTQTTTCVIAAPRVELVVRFLTVDTILFAANASPSRMNSGSM